MAATLLQSIALFLTVEAAVFLASASLGLNVDLIKKMARVEWDRDRDVIRSLAHQAATTKIGIVFLGTGAVFQVAGIWGGQSIDEVGGFDARGFCIGLFLSVIAGVVGWLMARRIEKRIVAEADPPEVLFDPRKYE